MRPNRRLRLRWPGIAVALLFAFTSAPSQANRHALLIGVNDYTANVGLTNLRGPRNDLELIGEVLNAGFGVPRDHIRDLTDAQATHGNTEKAFGALAEWIKPGDFVYILYSGHGSHIPDPTGREARR